MLANLWAVGGHICGPMWAHYWSYSKWYMIPKGNIMTFCKCLARATSVDVSLLLGDFTLPGLYPIQIMASYLDL